MHNFVGEVLFSDYYGPFAKFARQIMTHDVHHVYIFVLSCKVGPTRLRNAPFIGICR